MIIESDDEMRNGWPLGLGNLNSRIRAADGNSPPPPQLRRSASFSSFSSSNLDTQSTASFFPDQSVSLGLLIGIKPPPNKKEKILYFEPHIPKTTSSDGLRLRTAHRGSSSPQGICVPLLHHVIGRRSRSGSGSRSSSTHL